MWSEAERRLLAVIQLKADESLDFHAARAQLTKRQVQHTLRRLRERDLIRPYSVVNLSRLGLVENSLFLSLSGQTRDTLKELLQRAQRSEKIVAVTKLGGSYNLSLDFAVKSHNEIDDELFKLFRGTKIVIERRELLVRLRRTIFQRKFFSSDRSKELLEIDLSEADMELGQLDRQILKKLSHWGEISYSDIARELGVSYSTVMNRIAYLKKQKVFLGRAYAYLIPDRLHGTYKVLTRLRSYESDDKEKFRKFIRAHLNTVVMIECLGAWDFEVRAEFENTSEAFVFPTEIFTAVPNAVSQVEMIPYLGTEKLTYYSP